MLPVRCSDGRAPRHVMQAVVRSVAPLFYRECGYKDLQEMVKDMGGIRMIIDEMAQYDYLEMEKQCEVRDANVSQTREHFDRTESAHLPSPLKPCAHVSIFRATLPTGG